MAHSQPTDPTAFRWRGLEMARIDAFSDVVFGFALTLLVVSLEVPHTFDELMHAMRGFVPFAICFSMLILVWYEHYKFFKRYALHDLWTIFLNTALLFVVLFYVYPLKFVFTLLVGAFTGTLEHGVIRLEDAPRLMQIYGAGFAAVYILFALMYVHAWRLRKELELNEFEELETRDSVTEHVGMACIGLLSVTIALVSRSEHASAYAGFVYWLIPVLHTVLGTRSGRRKRRLMERMGLSVAAKKG